MGNAAPDMSQVMARLNSMEQASDHGGGGANLAGGGGDINGLLGMIGEGIGKSISSGDIGAIFQLENIDGLLAMVNEGGGALALRLSDAFDFLAQSKIGRDLPNFYQGIGSLKVPGIPEGANVASGISAKHNPSSGHQH